MKTKDIKQKAIIPATPLEVYNTLIDSKKHSAFTSSVCKIGKKEGSSYSAYDGYIIGKTLKLIPGKKIVQTWQAVDDVWPEEYFSEITFDLKASPKGTEISFVHKGVPVNQVEEFKKGWPENYWEPLKIYFSEK
ncbi:MAG: SRPBCC domain-containing protein [Bacteroidota bacterium]|nr:SRPBCC domain-containing protein [Bacteroidota bacterium]